MKQSDAKAVNTLAQQLPGVKAKLEPLEKNTKRDRDYLKEQLHTLSKQTPIYEDAWAGNWVEHTNVYRYCHNAQNDELRVATEKDIKTDLEQKTGIRLDDLRTAAFSLLKEFRGYQTFLVTELSFLHDAERFDREKQLLKQIESFRWGFTKGDYVRSREPKQIYTTDLEILNRGLATPPHILVAEEIVISTTIIAALTEFIELAHRLIRQLEIKIEDTAGTAVNEDQSLYNLLERFHGVALQLRERHENRSTVAIADEYDVQDLLHALLRLYYDDIRPEEYSPSYAGKTSRMDFLLKREKMVVEVKKTRPNLKAKELGEELIIDIAR